MPVPGCRRTRWRAAVVGVALAVGFTGCQAKAGLELDLRADGTGSVRVDVHLDPAAAAAAGDLAANLRVADLRAGGWQVEVPPTGADGSAEVVASRTVAGPDDAARALAGVAGPAAVRDVRIGRVRTAWRTRTAVSAVVDLGAGIDTFTDERLRTTLGGPGLGIAPAALAEALGGASAQALQLTVALRLPGRATATERGAVVRGRRASWSVLLGQRLAIGATSSAANRRTILAAAVSAGAGALLVLVLLGRVARAGLRRRGRGRGRRSAVLGTDDVG